MKIELTIDVPTYKWIDVPTLYWTPLGEFETQDEVDAAKELIEYLQRSPDRHAIINMEYRMRGIVCNGLVRDRLPGIADLMIHSIAEHLSSFLMGFSQRTGRVFDDYKFEFRVLSNGQKIQFESFSMLFNNEDDALRHIARIYVEKRDFAFLVLDQRKKD